MTQIALRAARVPAPRLRLPISAWAATMLGSAAVVGMLSIKQPFVARLLVGVCVLGTFFVIALHGRVLALTLVLIWLTFLGFTRRLLIPFVGWPEFDPLLLIGPACAAILLITAPRGRSKRTPMSTAAVLLTAVAVAQSINPSSGSAGLLALLFWVGPLLWFFVGRTFGDGGVDRLFASARRLLVPVAGHGLFQSFVTLLPFELTWVGVSGFGAAIFLEGFRIRPFSTLVSPQEYGYFLSFALVCLWCHILTGGARLRNLLLFGVGGFALFTQGSRGVFLFFVVAIGATATIRSRSVPVAMFSISLFAFLALIGTQKVVQGPQSALGERVAQAAEAAGGTAGASAVRHQIRGFTDPASSTLPLHLSLIRTGFEQAFDAPLGFGLGHETIAVKKVGQDRTSAENDVAAVFSSLGLPGGLLYLGFIMVCFVEAFRRVRRRLDTRTLTAVGLLLAFTSQWWAGQMYTASSFFWLVLGWLSLRPSDAQEETRAAA